MAEYSIKFDVAPEIVRVPFGSLITEAARLAGVNINQPCGGQGRCGRCAVKVVTGAVRRRSVLRLLPEDIEQGYVLACQSVIEGDAYVEVPPQERVERKLTIDRVVVEIGVPENYNFFRDQSIQRFRITLPPPSMDDQRDDLSRMITAIRHQIGVENFTIPLSVLKKLGSVLREGDWQITLILDTQLYDEGGLTQSSLIDISSAHEIDDKPLWGVAIDIGTTTVTLLLVDLISGQVKAQVSEYNGQIARGEDVISRIIYASKEGGAEELQALVLTTIHELLDRACKRVKGFTVDPTDIVKATIAGNSTMMHLLLGIPAESIRLSPFITAVNEVPVYSAKEIGIKINPEAVILCLPGVASYVGADITAGVYSSGMDDTSQITLFMDVGTNGEIVLGSREWLVTCACSAGPAFEGAGVISGMRATDGAIEEVWVNSENYEPTYRVIGGGKPRGICGSGLISLLAELFMTGVVDKAGHLKQDLSTPRIREGGHGLEYVVAWGRETEHKNDITLTIVDIDNLIRAKGAIYAGYRVLADRVGVPLEVIDQMLIGGSFGKYINIEKAIQIGLLPDMPWDRFQFLGNTSVNGAYLALLDQEVHQRIRKIASRMTYIELSADNTFYEAFMSSLFLPHTDLNQFPSIKALIDKKD